jgi:hypothetical protein
MFVDLEALYILMMSYFCSRFFFDPSSTSLSGGTLAVTSTLTSLPHHLVQQLIDSSYLVTS